MSIDLSQISARRIDRIRNADSFEQASKMNILDRLIDTIFRNGAKKEAIRELYSVVCENNSGTHGQMQAFLNLPSLLLPSHRNSLQLEVSERPDGSCDYTLRLDKHEIYKKEEVNAKEDIAALKRARNSVEVDDFLMKLQNFDSKAASLVQRSDRFLIEQGKTGDCYILAAMIGIMSNPAMQESIENMTQITSDGKLRLTFDADISARITKDLFLGTPQDLDNENLASILKHDVEIKNLSKKGYELAIKGNQLHLEISQDRLSKIINETKSAESNSLIVNILEHFTGNLLRYPIKTYDPNPVMEEELAYARTNVEAIAIIKKNGIYKLSDLRSDRESILAHNYRAGNYQFLVTTLLGYKEGKSSHPEDKNSLKQCLHRFNNEELCLSKGGKQGFVFIGMKYGAPDKNGRNHPRHALTLKDIEFNSKNEPTGVFLINPWRSGGKPEYYTLTELIHRSAEFISFHSPTARIAEDKGEESTQISSRPTMHSLPTFEAFDLFA